MFFGGEKVDFWMFHDALRVFEVQHRNLDLGYLNDWAARLGVQPLWDRLQAEAEAV